MNKAPAPIRFNTASPMGVVLACFGTLAVLEQLWPLRVKREPKARRWARNLALAGLGAIVQSVEQSLSRRLTQSASGRAGKAPSAVRSLLGLLAMDYTLYLWHRLTHEVGILWRFHAVHHADLDLDASTALRFHVGELVLSIPWRMAQLKLFGISARDLRIWQTTFSLSVLFQHSNVRLPERLERMLAYVIVTPRLHGIHHSSRASERNSNWTSGLTVWDRWHGTFRDDVAQSGIEIGIPEAQSSARVAFMRLLLANLEPREEQEDGDSG